MCFVFIYIIDRPPVAEITFYVHLSSVIGHVIIVVTALYSNTAKKKQNNQVKRLYSVYSIQYSIYCVLVAKGPFTLQCPRGECVGT